MVDPDVESWENVSQGKVCVNKFGAEGTHTVVQEVVASGRKVLVTPKERTILNSERCYSDELDPFKNGNLRPLTLASTSDDVEENPNHMSESDMRALFDLRNWMQFRAAVNEISSPQILRILHQMATSDDDEDLNVTVKQLDTIDERLREVTGQSDVTEVQHAGAISSSMAEDDDRRTIMPMRRD